MPRPERTARSIDSAVVADARTSQRNRSAGMFSSRSEYDQRPNALSIALDVARAHARDGTGRRVLDLTTSNPTTCGIPYASDAILGALSSPRALVYEPLAFGMASAREAVAKDLTLHRVPGADPARIMLTASTSEAYSFLFKLLCDPGDEVLVPQPSYPLFELLASFESVRLVPYRLAYDGAWHIDEDSLARAVSPRTRAVLVVSPNNPTGSFLKRAELPALARTGLPIISDEVFARYPLTTSPGRATSILELDGPLVFSLGGLSKLAALPQMKLAWTVVGGPPALVADALARLELICDSFLSISAPVAHALPFLLDSRGVAEDAIRARTRTNLAALRSALAGARSPATLLDVEGGWYATLRLPRTQSEERWALDLLETDGVYVHPGHFFDFAGEAFVVLSLLTPEGDLAEGVARIVSRVASGTTP